MTPREGRTAAQPTRLDVRLLAAGADPASAAGPVLLPVLGAEAWLDRALAAGEAPGAALAAWRARTADLLARFRRARTAPAERLFLVRAGDLAAAGTGAAEAALAEMLGAPVALVGEAAGPEARTPETPMDALLGLLGRLVLAADAEAIRLGHELEAAALRLDGAAGPDAGPGETDPDATFLAAMAGLAAERAAAAERVDRAARIEREFDDLRQSLAEKVAALEELRVLEADLVEMAALREEIRTLRRRAEERQRAQAETEGRLAAERAAREAAEARVRDLEGSTSWRITAPMRAVSRRVRPR